MLDYWWSCCIITNDRSAASVCWRLIAHIVRWLNGLLSALSETFIMCQPGLAPVPMTGWKIRGTPSWWKAGYQQANEPRQWKDGWIDAERWKPFQQNQKILSWWLHRHVPKHLLPCSNTERVLPLSAHSSVSVWHQIFIYIYAHSAGFGALRNWTDLIMVRVLMAQNDCSAAKKRGWAHVWQGKVVLQASFTSFINAFNSESVRYPPQFH